MKKTLRVIAALMVMVSCAAMLMACGTEQPAPSTDAATVPTTVAPTTTAPEETTASTEVVKLADRVVQIVSFDEDLITVNPYAVSGDTIDFMAVDASKLGEAGAMELVYVEGDCVIYAIVEGKLVDATADDVVVDAVVGITAYSDGRMELYIISVPEDSGDEYQDDPLDVVEEDVLPEETTLPAETEAEEGVQ